jgi:hypothetical protein
MQQYWRRGKNMVCGGLILTGAVAIGHVSLSAYKMDEVTDPFIVHEWGTFTTLHGSDGKRIGGLQIEEEVLPSFVHQHGKIATNELPVKAGKLPVYGSKIGYLKSTAIPGVDDYQVLGNGIGVKNVNVKMETPVLYFYSEKKMNVEVQVDFPRGTISQWYPQRTSGEELVANSQYDFRDNFNGSINWKATVLERGSERSLTPNKNLESNTWIAPRATKANKVTANGEVENFLFYRGMANFDIPISTHFNSFTELQLQNHGNDEIPFMLVYEKKKDGTTNYWWTGKMKHRQSKKIDLALKPSGSKEMLSEFEDALVAEGLYKDEAKAMLSTWKHSYFQKPGLRAFWIVPEKEIDRILPISVMPRPAEMKRVFVGRCDILKPEFELAILKGERGEYYNDRHFMSYEERKAQLTEDYFAALQD